jgi:hypothetical protein
MTDFLNEFRGNVFTGPVDVDANRFIDCTFDNAQLRYGGAGHPEFQNCTFNGASWYFHDAALRTIQLLQMQNLKGENNALIDDIFRPGNVLKD